MRFVDEVTVTVEAGAGGNGCVAFRREAHVPRGGPSGGDGGRGGDVVFVADAGLSTLLDLRYQKSYRATRGTHGQGHDRHGRGGADREVRVPCGTLVFDAASGELLCDIVAAGQRFIAAKGGRGGRGNARFATSTNQAPRIAEPGEPGELRDLRVELKVLAEVGLVGLPNAGKSTLVSRVSAARPRIADYPFTTLIPHLGVVALSGERSFVMADIPGLVEGAHSGVGLGHRFLRHVERTRVLVFLLDDRHLAADEPGSPAEDHAVLCRELSAHAEELAQRPAIVALNKIDLLPPERVDAILASLPAGALPISAATGAGVSALLEAIWSVLERARAAEAPSE